MSDNFMLVAVIGLAPVNDAKSSSADSASLSGCPNGIVSMILATSSKTRAIVLCNTLHFTGILLALLTDFAAAFVTFIVIDDRITML